MLQVSPPEYKPQPEPVFAYKERLIGLHMYSLQRRRERSICSHLCVEIIRRYGSQFIATNSRESIRKKRSHLCACVVDRGHIGSLAYNSFRWRGSRIFNALTPAVRNMSKCSVNVFKRKLNNLLSQVPDDPCETNSDNSIAGVALRQSWCLQRDGRWTEDKQPKQIK